MHIQHTEDTRTVIDYLTHTLQERLSGGKRVTWLIPGGSALAIAVAVAENLANTDLSKLSISLTDERFGAVGHPDSNWQQLKEAGFSLTGATLYPVLRGAELNQTVAAYATNLHTLLDQADYSIGLFGMGADGHTAGILPYTPAADSTAFAAGYTTETFVRTTMTFPAIQQLDESILYACGSDKLTALTQLTTQDIDVREQPAQIHKQLTKSTLYTDQKEII